MSFDAKRSDQESWGGAERLSRPNKVSVCKWNSSRGWPRHAAPRQPKCAQCVTMYDRTPPPTKAGKKKNGCRQTNARTVVINRSIDFF